MHLVIYWENITLDANLNLSFRNVRQVSIGNFIVVQLNTLIPQDRTKYDGEGQPPDLWLCAATQ